MKTFLLTITSLALCLSLIGCGGAANSNAVNKPANATPAANSNSNANAEATPSATPTNATAPTGSLATPTDAYKTAYALREKKDIEGLKKIMSKDAKEFFTEIAKAEKKSLDDILKEMFEKPQAKTDQSRNEKIDGDHATLEYPDEDGDWKTMDFEKVDGKWLLSLPKRDKDDK